VGGARDRRTVAADSGIDSDITALKKAEDSLLQAQKMQAMGTLAGGIAHDFNNILLAITGHAGFAAEDLPKEHPVQRDVEEINKAATRASDLVRQILTFSRRQEPSGPSRVFNRWSKRR